MRGSRGLRGLGALALASAVTMSTAAPPAMAADKTMKVAFVEVTTASASGWVSSNVNGAKYAAEKLPWVETTVVESIQEGPAVVAVLKGLAQKGYKIVFADGYGYAAFVPAVADQFPDTVFIVQQATPKAANVGSYYGYLEQARYVQGVVAGLTTKTNKIGFVGAYVVSPVIAGVNAFALGVQSVNPNAVVKVNWVNSWNDPPKEKEAAEALLNEGADVIGNHSDSAAH